MVATLFIFLAAVALYLVFAGSLSGTEIGAGVVVAALVAAADRARRQCDTRVLRPHAPWARLLGRVLRALVRDTMTVGAALLQAALVGPRTRSGIARQGFRPGGETPRDDGRRAIVTLLGSLAPNGIVTDVPPSPMLGKEPVLLVHRLVASEPSPDREWPM